MEQNIEKDLIGCAAKSGIAIEIVIAAGIEMWNDDFKGDNTPAHASDEEEDAQAGLLIFPDDQETEQSDSEGYILFTGSGQQAGEEEPGSTSIAESQQGIKEQGSSQADRVEVEDIQSDHTGVQQITSSHHRSYQRELWHKFACQQENW